jgi:hypothetical protein
LVFTRGEAVSLNKHPSEIAKDESIKQRHVETALLLNALFEEDSDTVRVH